MVATLTIQDDPAKKRAKPDLAKKTNDGCSDEDVLFFAGEIKRKQDAVKAAAKELSRTKKRCINAGITMAQMLEAMEIAEIGADAALERFSRLIRYTKALGEPIAVQLTLFEAGQPAPSREAEMNRAEAAGYALGLMGKNADEQRYPPDTDLGQAHLEGWHRGQKVLSTKFMELNAQNEAEEKQAKADAEAKARKAEQKKKDAEDKAKKKADADKANADLKAKREADKAAKAAAKKNGGGDRPAAH